MKNRRLLVVFCGILLAANVGFIWGNSMLPGTASAQLSGGLMQWIGELFAVFGEHGEKVLRKMAHMAEFASLGFLLTGFFRLLGKKRIYLPLLCGFITATVDECIQIFSPGRSSSVVDVMIDMSGLAAGIILLLMGQLLFRRKNKMEET